MPEEKEKNPEEEQKQNSQNGSGKGDLEGEDNIESDNQKREDTSGTEPEKSDEPDKNDVDGADTHPDEEIEHTDPYDAYYEEGYSEDEEHDDFITAEKENAKGKGTKAESNFDDGDEDEEDIPPGNPEKKMPFLDHLEELRWTILWSLIAVLVAAVGCYIFAKEIIDILLKPLPEGESLIFLSPTGGFMIYIKVAFFAGLIVALPFVVYQFWKFIVPGLLEKEKKIVPPIAFFTVLCFAIGATFAYFIIIPFGLKFLLGFETEAFQATIEIGKYLGFVVTIILVFGTVFELPVLSFFLTKVGVLNPEFLRSKRRYGIVIIFIVAAVLTPPDIFTQLMLAGPLIILYEISIWISKIAQKKSEDSEKEESGISDS